MNGRIKTKHTITTEKALKKAEELGKAAYEPQPEKDFGEEATSKSESQASAESSAHNSAQNAPSENAANTRKHKQTADEEPEKLENLDARLPLMNHGVIKKVWDKVLFLWEKLKSPEVPFSLKITIAGALLYLILPADILPDSIPGIGLLDDLSVILVVFKEVTKYAIPKIEQKFYEETYQKIDQKLQKIFKATCLNTLITFLINATGCIILIVKPFEDSSLTNSGCAVSRYAALSLFAFAFIYSLICLIKYLKKNRRTTFLIAKEILHTKSVSHGISNYVTQEYADIAKFYAGVKLVKNFIPQVECIPDLPQIIKTFEKHYKTRVILFVLAISLYTVLIFVTRALLLKAA